MVLNQSNTHLRIFADNVHIFRAFHHDCIVEVVSFVKTYDWLPFQIVANCELTLTSIAFSLALWTFNELLHF